MMRATRGDGLQPRNGQETLAKQAKQVDQKIRAAVKTLRGSCTELGALLARMKDRHLWRFLPGNKYRSFEDYATAALGQSMSRSRVYELVAAHMLTEGTNAIPAATVARMGIKKAAELARLEPAQRTPQLVRTAVEQSLPVVKRVVQARINMYVPPDQQREMTQLFSINLPDSIIEEVEEYLEIAIWMEGIRDGDTTVSMRQKAFGTLVIGAREYFAPELADALQYMKVRQAKENGTQQAAEEDLAEQEEGPDFPDDDQV
jgi:hypothetical protein